MNNFHDIIPEKENPETIEEKKKEKIINNMVISFIAGLVTFIVFLFIDNDPIHLIPPYYIKAEGVKIIIPILLTLIIFLTLDFIEGKKE